MGIAVALEAFLYGFGSDFRNVVTITFLEIFSWKTASFNATYKSITR